MHTSDATTVADDAKGTIVAQHLTLSHYLTNWEWEHGMDASVLYWSTYADESHNQYE